MTTTEIFHGKFCPGIRVQFDWRRFFVESWPIEVVVLRDKRAFDALRLPWCLNASNAFVNYDAPSASPVSLGDVPQWLEYLPSNMRATIKQFEGEFRSGARTTELEIPSYALPANRYLVLDGNHSLSALTLCGLPFVVHMYVVKGPIDQNVLPDIVHFTGNRSLSDAPMGIETQSSEEGS